MHLKKLKFAQQTVWYNKTAKDNKQNDVNGTELPGKLLPSREALSHVLKYVFVQIWFTKPKFLQKQKRQL